MTQAQQTIPSRTSENRRRLSVAYYFDLILTLTQKEVKVRYKNNVLGYLWSIANPLASAMVFYFAFQVVFNSNIENYVIFLVIGLFCWQWFANYLLGACTVFLSNGSLIKRSIFPRFVLPVALDLQDTFHYFMSIPITLGFLYAYGIKIGWSIPAGILILMPAQFLFLLGIGLAVSSINLFFRDMERILAIGLNMMFYLSPVIFPIDRVPAPYSSAIYLNPMTPIIEAWRGIFLKNTLQWDNIGLAYLYAGIAMAIGILVYRFAEVI